MTRARTHTHTAWIPAKVNCHERPEKGDIVVVVAITYDARSFTIDYVSSENLQYDDEEGRIHRGYNRWVANLEERIKRTVALGPQGP